MMESPIFLRYFEEKKRYFRRYSYTDGISVHSSRVNSLDWNIDGKYLACASSDSNICIIGFDKEKIRKKLSLKGHSSTVNKVCWDPKSSDCLLSTSDDRTLCFWDIRAENATQKINLSTESYHACFNPLGYQFALSKKNDSLSVYDTRTMSILHEENYKFSINEMSWNPSSTKFYATAGSEGVLIYDTKNFKLINTLQAGVSSCNCIKVNPQDKYFAVGGSDSIVSLWDTNELVCVRTFYRLDYPTRSIGFNYDGQMLAISSEDSFIDVSMTELGDQVCEIKSSGTCYSVSWHPRFNILAYSHLDKDKSDSSDSAYVYIFGLSSGSSSFDHRSISK